MTVDGVTLALHGESWHCLWEGKLAGAGTVSLDVDQCIIKVSNACFDLPKGER